ncbi:hypothetical protein ASPBRDRAFT_191955 [Aspergillus brasiliensis CBS 101740]|uniref:F-box domain-containing protein n=1 Tax=Aspergillus brasiliensis (strain CBS 101740 / IMI 381727 / IBT 21946) TaxID=767769 RepID=A0A1L9UW00_ASPBC|nr:hypothetical protein ASPBRDRAFT_191955 [Aspergillus brasiliensis CBS 101740]
MESAMSLRIKNPVAKVFGFWEKAKTAAERYFVERFPLEIIYIVFFLLDFPSLEELRLVNTTFKGLVESIAEYRFIREYAYEAVCMMCRTHISSYYTIKDIYNELRYPQCRTCPEFGPFLHLPTLRRCCYKCNAEDPSYRLARLCDLRVYFHLEDEDFRDIPLINCMLQPGTYIASVSRSMEIVGKLYGPDKAQQIMEANELQGEGSDEGGNQFWMEDLRNDGGQPSNRSRIPWGELGTPWMQFRATAPFPYYDHTKGPVEHGTYCRTCCGEIGRELEHTRDIGNARKWEYYRAFRETELSLHWLECHAEDSSEDSSEDSYSQELA